MTVISVSTADHIGQGEGAIDEEGKKTYTRVFVVATDDASDDASIVLAAEDLPQPNSTYSSGNGSDANALAKTFAARRMGRQPKNWLVTVTYMPIETGELDNEPADPTDVEQWVPRISISTVTFSQPVDDDAAGRVIANSAGVPVKPKLERDQNRPRITITRNERTPDWFALFNLVDTVNLGAWSGFNIGQLKMAGITGTDAIFDDGSTRYRYYEVVYTIDAKMDGWVNKILDEGITELVEEAPGGQEGTENPHPTVGAPQIQLRASLGEPVRKPVLLNGRGKVLPEGGEPVFLEYMLYRRMWWDGLNLPPLNFTLTP